MPLAAFQNSIAAAIAADAFFAGVPVLIDDGRTLAAQEEALATAGVVIVVSPCLTLRNDKDTRSSLVAEASYAVHLRTSPEVNLGAGGANLSPHAAVLRAVTAIVAAHRAPSSAFDSVRPAASIAELVAEDSGLLTYTLLFNARVKLAL